MTPSLDAQQALLHTGQQQGTASKQQLDSWTAHWAAALPDTLHMTPPPPSHVSEQVRQGLAMRRHHAAHSLPRRRGQPRQGRAQGLVACRDQGRPI